MKVKLINGAQMPKQGRPGDAGYDLFLNDDVVFKAHTTTVVDTGVCVKLPEGHAGLLAMRSSVCKTGMIIQQPLIDENYITVSDGLVNWTTYIKNKDYVIF